MEPAFDALAVIALPACYAGARLFGAIRRAADQVCPLRWAISAPRFCICGLGIGCSAGEFSMT